MLIKAYLALLLTFSVLLLIVGLVKPSSVIVWGDEKTKNRISVLKYYGIASLIFIILFNFSLKTNDIKDNELSEEIELDEVKEKFELLDSDNNLLSKNYDDLSYEEMKRFDLLLDNFFDLSDEDQEKIIDNLNRLEEQKIAREEEKARILAEQEAEEARLQAEKEAEEARIQAEKEAEEARLQAEYEKEKYNTDITRNDIARDKGGLYGSYVTFSGRIIQVTNEGKYTQYRMAVNDDLDQTILLGVENSKLDFNILKDDFITIEGMSVGNITYETVLGSTVTVPGVIIDNIYY